MSRELKVGLLVVISGAILYLGFNFLKGKDFFTSDNRYYVAYDNIEGLTVSNPVILNGYTVGRVERIVLEHDKGDRLLVSLKIKGKIPVNSETIAELASDGLLGGKAIKLKLGNGEELGNNDTLKAKKEESLTALLERTALPVVGNIDTLVSDFKKYMTGQNEKNITNTIANIDSTTTNFKKMSATLMYMMARNQSNINATTSNIAVLTKELNETMKDLKPVLTNVKGFTDSLSHLDINETLNSANSSINKLNGILSSVQGDTGTLGKLMNSPEIHNNLNMTLKDIDYLVTDMQANPSRYINVSVIAKTPEDQKPIANEKKVSVNSSGLVEIPLKREAPALLKVVVWRPDKTKVELTPSGLGTEKISFNLPADFTGNTFLVSLNWHSGSQSFNLKR